VHKVLVLVPFPLSDAGVDNRRAQTGHVTLGSDIQFDYRPARASCAMFDSPHDWLLADMGVYEAGASAQDDGYDAVCIDSMSDSGIGALRSVLDIPVIGPARTSYMMALTLGDQLGIVTYGDPDGGRVENNIFRMLYKKSLKEYGIADRCASIQSSGVESDWENLLTGMEDTAFPALLEAGHRCVADGADVIVLGSTTLHQAGSYLAENLPVPVINPGPLTYKMAELVLGLNLTHSRMAFPAPAVPKIELVHAMLDAAETMEKG
jgi:allantoin racemase